MAQVKRKEGKYLMTDLEQEDIRRVAELPYDWKRLNNKTVMISGGTGFIGTFISDVIQYRNEKYGENIKVVSISRRSVGKNKNVVYMNADITEPIQYNEKVDVILHLASNTHPKQYRVDPVGTITTNIIGCDNLLKLMVGKHAERFLLASSVEIYGQGTEVPMREDFCGYIDCNLARSGYNEAKRTCEALCESYAAQYGVDCVIARLARTIGADRKHDTKAMAQFMEKAVAGEDIILKSKGAQRYSYSYIADTVSGIFKILLDGKTGEAYNVADDDDGYTLGQYAECIAKLAGREVVYRIEEDSAASKATYALLDTQKIKSLGWEPLYSVRDALERTYRIYMNSPANKSQ